MTCVVRAGGGGGGSVPILESVAVVVFVANDGVWVLVGVLVGVGFIDLNSHSVTRSPENSYRRISHIRL